MANLSNINNILRVSSSGVGLNKNNTGPSELDIESSGADMIDMTRTGQKTYRFAISGASAFSLFDVAANADRLIIDSSGNSTFAGALNVNGNATLANYSGTGENYTILAQNSYGQMRAGIRSGVPYIGSISSLPLDIYTGNSSKIRIQTDGNVGIGTDSPTNIASGYTSVTTNGTNGGGLVMQVNGTATGYLYAESGALVLNNTSGVMQFYNAGSERMRLKTSGSTIQDVTLQLKTTGASDNTGIMFINSGNTSSFNDIAGIASFVESGSAKGNLQFWTRNSDGDNSDVATRMRIDSSGNVGISGYGIQIDRPDVAGGKPYIFWKSGGTTQGSIYGASSGAGLRIFLSGGTAAFDNSISFTGIVQQNAQSVVLSNSAYSNAAAVQAYATNTANVYPGYGFHKASNLGGFLYATSRTELRYRGDGGTDKVLLMADSDYEQGTWTPVTGPSTTTPTYLYRSGYYTKVGNLVTCTFGLKHNGGVWTGGEAIISGLPFTIASTGPYQEPMFIVTTIGNAPTGVGGNNANGALNLGDLSFYLGGGGTIGRGRRFIYNNDSVLPANNVFATTSFIKATIIYYTTQ